MTVEGSDTLDVTNGSSYELAYEKIYKVTLIIYTPVPVALWPWGRLSL
jgi:hypothetical protein